MGSRIDLHYAGGSPWSPFKDQNQLANPEPGPLSHPRVCLSTRPRVHPRLTPAIAASRDCGGDRASPRAVGKTHKTTEFVSASVLFVFFGRGPPPCPGLPHKEQELAPESGCCSGKDRRGVSEEEGSARGSPPGGGERDALQTQPSRFWPAVSTARPLLLREEDHERSAGSASKEAFVPASQPSPRLHLPPAAFALFTLKNKPPFDSVSVLNMDIAGARVSILGRNEQAHSHQSRGCAQTRALAFYGAVTWETRRNVPGATLIGQVHVRGTHHWLWPSACCFSCRTASECVCISKAG